MVQREIADRLRAAPGSRTYGSPSVVAQLACEVELVRKVDPAVFRPRPRVDSAILRLRRTGPGADAGDPRPGPRRLRPPPQVPGPLARARPARARWRRRARRWPSWACAEDARAEALSPERVRRPVREAPGRRLTAARRDARPRPRQAQPLPLPRPPPRRRPARALLAVRAAGAGRPDRGRRGRARRGRLPRGRGREPRRAGAGGAARARAGSGRRCGSRSRSGSRSRPGSAAAAPTPPRSCASPPARSTTCQRLAAELGADVPSQLRPGAGAGRAAPASGSSALPDPAPHAVVLLPGGGGLSTADVFAEADRLGLGRDAGGAGRAWPPACARRPAPAPRRSPTPSCSSTTSSRRRARCARRSATPSTRCATPARRSRC